MRDLKKAPSVIHKLVHVHKSMLDIKGSKPIQRDGYYGGLVVGVKPVTDKTGEFVVDYTLEVKLWYGTAQEDRVHKISFNDKRWILLYAKKGEL